MRQSSIIIHKGGKEEKYEIYIEDYVMSFLKEETGTLELSEFFFYGFRENNKRYIIYGAGRDKKTAVFGKYDLLDEIGCRLTQAGPVFQVREENGIYEIKGYEVFYQDNKEMQNYLIERRRESAFVRADRMGGSAYVNEPDEQKIPQNRAQHSAISVQLGIILVALIAIVINSTNSYDKMNQLNRSASEVLFAIENQETEVVAEADNGRDEIVVERSAEQTDEQPDEPDNDEAVSDSGQVEDVLKLVTLENEGYVEEAQGEDNTDIAERSDESGSEQQDKTVVESDADETTSREQNSEEGSDEQEGVEALSRNVTRYYEVERGDTLYTISRKIYGDITHVQRICELNDISDPDHIRYGQKIMLP